MDFTPHVADPVKMCYWLWPDDKLTRYQEDILYSLRDNRDTVVPAANQMGKDWVTARAVLWFFLSRHPCRVVTTSADHAQLEAVLWGEVRAALQRCRYRLRAEHGGPLVVNHLLLRKALPGGEVCGTSYCVGRVAAKGEGLLGHHVGGAGDGVPRTLFVADESSGVDEESVDVTDSWAQRRLFIGNTFDSGVNGFWKRWCRAGDVPDPVDAGRLLRKVVHVPAAESPNVRYALAQERAGLRWDGRQVVPGVLSYPEYRRRLASYDPVSKCVKLDALFWEGADALLFPPDWLDAADKHASDVDLFDRGDSEAARFGFNNYGAVVGPGGRPASRRKDLPKAIGVDPAEGGDKTTWAVVDDLGLVEIVSSKTPDTAVITGTTEHLMARHDVPPGRVCFDRGGGGKQHADRLRADRGLGVRTVAFGEPASPPPDRSGPVSRGQGVSDREDRTRFKNRRAEMYWGLRARLDPALLGGRPAFALPFHRGGAYADLRAQLAPVPLLFGGEGEFVMLPKSIPAAARERNRFGGRRSLTELLGRSPDEADAVVLALYALTSEPERPAAGGEAW